MNARKFLDRTLGLLGVAAVFAGVAPAQAQTEGRLGPTPPAPPSAPTAAATAQRNADETAARNFFVRLGTGELSPAELPQRIVVVRSAKPLWVDFMEPADLKLALAPCKFAGLGLRHVEMMMSASAREGDLSTPRKYSGHWKCSYQGKDFQVTAIFELTGGKVDKLIFAPSEGN